MVSRRAWKVITTTVVLAVTIVGCSGESGDTTETRSSTSSTPASSTTTKPPTPAELAEGEALAAYDGFWKALNAAKASPSAKDWTEDISEFTADPARAEALGSIRNYASIPAHFEGEPDRVPTVTSVSLEQPPRVLISDCLDVTDVSVLHDTTGESVGDTANQPLRYIFDAEVVLYTNLTPPRWLVQITQPRLEQSC